eukprot:TRINITY_DN94718_c0_g1_i1.p1 TRINITY_DN94718_c0_g1~~TRINITY_DN94718_c0_g1_i1.p1  ORF type:complete len:298 (-),score=78.57 TRINITY_DN94718_c0_g1_i1:127-1020(-)
MAKAKATKAVVSKPRKERGGSELKQREKAQAKRVAKGVAAAEAKKQTAPKKPPPPPQEATGTEEAEEELPQVAEDLSPEERQKAIEHRLKIREFKNSLLLSGFPFEFDECQLVQYFSQYGGIKRHYWPRSTKSGKPYGNGIVQFDSQSAMRKALEDASGMLVGDNRVTVREMRYDDWTPNRLQRMMYAHQASRDRLRRRFNTRFVRKVLVKTELPAKLKTDAEARQHLEATLKTITGLAECSAWQGFGWAEKIDTKAISETTAAWKALPDRSRFGPQSDYAREKWSLLRQQHPGTLA